MTRRLVSCAFFTAVVSACTPVSSTDIRTSGIYASISGLASGSGPTQVNTTLQLGALSTSFVDLTSEDSLTATSGSESVTLSKSSLLGLISYSASMSGDEEGKKITVAPKRGAMDTGAPNSVITMPAKFQLSGPAANAMFKRGIDSITVNWDNSGKSDAMTVALDGSCITPLTLSAPSDSGSLVISATEVKASKDNETKTCDVTVTVRRAHTGTIDPAYGKGGSVTGYQERRISVKSTP